MSLYDVQTRTSAFDWLRPLAQGCASIQLFSGDASICKTTKLFVHHSLFAVCARRLVSLLYALCDHQDASGGRPAELVGVGGSRVRWFLRVPVPQAFSQAPVQWCLQQEPGKWETDCEQRWDRRNEKNTKHMKHTKYTTEETEMKAGPTERA